MDANEIVEKWDRGISDILERFSELLEEATAASGQLIESLDLDMGSLIRPWNAVENRMHDFTEELSDLWDEISDDLSEIDDLDDDVMDQEGEKLDRSVLEIEIKYHRSWIEVMSRAAEKMRCQALRADAISRQCTQCGAQLDKVKPVSQALNVECEYCRSINTIEPSDALRIFAASGSMYLGEMEAIQHWEVMRRVECMIDEYRSSNDVPLSLLEDYEQSAISYWMTRLEVEASFVPEDKKYIPVKLERYMKDVERKLRQHWQWRKRSGE